MVKNVIFDMGQVLIRWTPGVLMDKLGVSVPDQDLIKEKMYSTPEWVLMDWGLMDEEDMEAFASSRLPERLMPVVHKLLYGWFEDMVPMPGMRELLRDLKAKGYSLFILSNASERLSRYIRNIPGSEYMDGWVVSGCEKMIKPNPEIFHLICSRFGLKEEECIFIDDLKANCAGARVAGMDCFLFKENIRELRSVLGV